MANPGGRRALQGAHDGTRRGDGAADMGLASRSLPPASGPPQRGRHANADWHAEGAERAGSLEEALELLRDDERVFVIGGAEIYAEAFRSPTRCSSRRSTTTSPATRSSRTGIATRSSRPPATSTSRTTACPSPSSPTAATRRHASSRRSPRSTHSSRGRASRTGCSAAGRSTSTPGRSPTTFGRRHRDLARRLPRIAALLEKTVGITLRSRTRTAGRVRAGRCPPRAHVPRPAARADAS